MFGRNLNCNFSSTCKQSSRLDSGQPQSMTRPVYMDGSEELLECARHVAAFLQAERGVEQLGSAAVTRAHPPHRDQTTATELSDVVLRGPSEAASLAVA